jgi:diamine N-acetyltransferase
VNVDTAENQTVQLKEITAKTVWPIMNLDVAEYQSTFVAPNAHSIAEAHFSQEAWFRGIYAGDIPVGFVMLHIDTNEPKYFLWRLMIDKGHQGKGYGFQAMQQVIEYVKTLSGANILETSYRPGEGDPSGFYYKLGFNETGEVLEGENVLRLQL